MSRAPAERFVYLACLHEGTGVDAPDFIVVVDADPDSDTDGAVVGATPMPMRGDGLHHFGWNRCGSACHGPDRSHLFVPGLRSSRTTSSTWPRIRADRGSRSRPAGSPIFLRARIAEPARRRRRRRP